MKAIWVAIFCFLTLSIFSQNRPHNIFAKCLIEGGTSGQEVEINSAFNVPEETLMIALAMDSLMVGNGDRSVKRKADRNCLSRNPYDCLVWCLIQGPIYELKLNFEGEHQDISDESWLTQSAVNQSVAGGYSFVWLPVVRESDLHFWQLKKLVKKLKKKKYISKKHKKKITNELIESLHKFQKDNGLPIGNLNFETLNFMGIDTKNKKS